MNDRASELRAPPRFRLGNACCWLTLALLAVWSCVCVHAHPAHGWAGIVAASVALLVNWLGAMAALLIVAVFRHGVWAIQAVLAATVFRMLVPFAAGIVLTQRGGALANAGVFGMIVVYYLVGLFVETPLAARLVGGSFRSVVRVV